MNTTHRICSCSANGRDEKTVAAGIDRRRIRQECGCSNSPVLGERGDWDDPKKEADDFVGLAIFGSHSATRLSERFPLWGLSGLGRL
jgi:hypothetical protein